MLHRLIVVVFFLMLAPAFIAKAVAQKAMGVFECKDVIKTSSVRWSLIYDVKSLKLPPKSNTIRFDYDEELMNISVIWNGVNYLYVPYKSTNITYYLLCNKIDGAVSSRSENNYCLVFCL